MKGHLNVAKTDKEQLNGAKDQKKEKRKELLISDREK